jgi:glucose/arabinose dehydrogenase
VALVAVLIIAKVFHVKRLVIEWFWPTPPTKVWDPITNAAILHRPADSEIRFEQTILPNTKGIQFTCVVVGPDGKLYAGADDGRIFRYPIRPDGTLDSPQEIVSLQEAEHGKRLLIGFCVDPAATADNPIIWVTHNFYAFREAPEWTSMVSRMRGKDLEIVEDVIKNLPRSYNDHLTNQPSFGPDGALYFPQGAMTSSGAPDDYWGNRAEHLLSATILRLDVTRVTPGIPLDVLTPDGGGNYDPYRRGAPLTIYASGIRNAYDLLWHSNGRLYVPTNGASNGGNTPGGNGVPALTNLPKAEHDWLFRITPGKYYGHPNPLQGHFVLNGGNPDGKEHPGVIPEYPVGTQPDADFEPAVLDCMEHASADGIIEYHGPAFHGKLDHRMLICRYSAGSDIFVVEVDNNGDVKRVQDGIPGLNDLHTPLDLTEDPKTGNIYVTEYLAKDISLLRPLAQGAITTQPSGPQENVLKYSH